MAEPPMHPLENPIVWLGLQLVELLIVVSLFRLLVPATWPRGAQVGLLLAVAALITWANYAARRRFIPR